MLKIKVVVIVVVDEALVGDAIMKEMPTMIKNHTTTGSEKIIIKRVKTRISILYVIDAT